MKLWRILLAAFLILWGLLAVTNVRFALQDVLVGLCAVGAGVLLLLDR